MIDHISLRVFGFHAKPRLLWAALAPLGYTLVFSHAREQSQASRGLDGESDRDNKEGGSHGLCTRADSAKEICATVRNSIERDEAGGRDNGGAVRGRIMVLRTTSLSSWIPDVTISRRSASPRANRATAVWPEGRITPSVVVFGAAHSIGVFVPSESVFAKKRSNVADARNLGKA